MADDKNTNNIGDDDRHLTYKLNAYGPLPQGERIGSFWVYRVELPESLPELLFRSSEALLTNKDLLKRVIKNADTIGPKLDSRFHLERKMYRPAEGEPHLFIVESTSGNRALDDLLKSNTRLPEETAIKYIENILDAFGAFHKHGYVYGGIDTRFVFVSPSGSAGSSVRLGGLFHVHPAGEDFAIGYNTEFLAPDEEDDKIDDRTRDVYTVGMLAYRLLLGEAAYKEIFSSAVSMTSDFDRVQQWRQIHASKYNSDTAFESIVENNSSVSSEVASVVERMMNLRSPDRFKDAFEAREALLGAQIEAQRRRALEASITANGLRPGINGGVVIDEGAKAKSKLPLVVGLLVGAAILGGGGYFGYDRFVKKPELALAAATKRSRDALSETEAVRFQAVQAVSQLQEQNELRVEVGRIDGIFSDLQLKPDGSEPSDRDRRADEYRKIGVSYSGVVEGVIALKEVSASDFDTARQAAANVIALLPENDPKAVEIVFKIDQLEALQEKGGYDVVTENAKESTSTYQDLEAELQSQRTEAIASVETLPGLVEQHASAHFEGSQAVDLFREKVAEVDQLFNKRRFAAANIRAQDIQIDIETVLSQRKARALTVLDNIKSIDSKLSELQAQVAHLSTSDPQSSALISLREKVDGATADVAAKKLADAERTIASVGPDIVALEQSIEVAQVEQAEARAQATLALEKMSTQADRYAGLLPDDASRRDDIVAAFNEARNLLSVGDVQSAQTQATDAAEKWSKAASVREEKKLAAEALKANAIESRDAVVNRIAKLSNGERFAETIQSTNSQVAAAETALTESRWDLASKGFETALGELNVVRVQIADSARTATERASLTRVEVDEWRATWPEGSEGAARFDDAIASIENFIEAGDGEAAIAGIETVKPKLSKAREERTALRDSVVERLTALRGALTELENGGIEEVDGYVAAKTALTSGQADVKGKDYASAISYAETGEAQLSMIRKNVANLRLLLNDEIVRMTKLIDQGRSLAVGEDVLQTSANKLKAAKETLALGRISDAKATIQALELDLGPVIEDARRNFQSYEQAESEAVLARDELANFDGIEKADLATVDAAVVDARALADDKAWEQAAIQMRAAKTSAEGLLKKAQESLAAMHADYAQRRQQLGQIRDEYAQMARYDETLLEHIDSDLAAADKQLSDGQLDDALAALRPIQILSATSLDEAQKIDDDLDAAIKNVQRARAGAESAGALELPSARTAQTLLSQANSLIAERKFSESLEKLKQVASAFEAATTKSATVLEARSKAEQELATARTALTHAANSQAVNEAAIAAFVERLSQIEAMELGEERDVLLAALSQEIAEAQTVTAAASGAAAVARDSFEAVYVQITAIEGHAEDVAFEAIKSARDDVARLFESQAFPVVVARYGELQSQAETFLKILQLPPKMSCVVENVEFSMRQIDGKAFDVSQLMNNKRFKREMSERMNAPDGAVVFSAQFCIQEQPLSSAEIDRFFKTLDASSRSRLPTVLQDLKASSQPVANLSRQLIGEYISWLSSTTGRQYRLPSVNELVVADYAFENSGAPIGDKFIWTDQDCNTSRAVVARTGPTLRDARTSCRLIDSYRNEDVFTRLVLEAPANKNEGGDEAE